MDSNPVSYAKQALLYALRWHKMNEASKLNAMYLAKCRVCGAATIITPTRKYKDLCLHHIAAGKASVENSMTE